MKTWVDALGPLLTAEQASEVVGSSARLAQLERENALIVLKTSAGELLYPFFHSMPEGRYPRWRKRIGRSANMRLAGHPRPGPSGATLSLTR